MSNHPFILDSRTLGGDGKDLVGTLPESFFLLEPQDDVQVSGPLRYDLHVAKDEEDFCVSGELEAAFSLVCGRCAERFPQKVHLRDYFTEVEENKENSIIDLTDAIREDILLSLPSYPRCENGNVQPRECPAAGQFQSKSVDDEPDEAPSQDLAVWEALDQLQTKR